MATSVSRIHAQIAKLQQQADVLKQAAVKRALREIELHGLTVEDLFGNTARAGAGRKAKSPSAGKPGRPKATRMPKYGDAAGNTWGGMGKRPQWLKDALEGGASLASFLLDAGVAKPTGAAAAKRTRKVVATPGLAKKATKKAAAKGASKRKVKRSVEPPAASA